VRRRVVNLPCRVTVRWIYRSGSFSCAGVRRPIGNGRP
jgi:hypothetical protein